MGCIWSSADGDRCMYCNRRPVNNLVLIDNVCEICVVRPSRQTINRYSRPSVSSVQSTPLYGEYRCSSCGRFWTSRLSWAGAHQLCKSCRIPVYPTTQRTLRPGDTTHGKEKHQREYCQMCQQLGSYCGNYGKRAPTRFASNKPTISSRRKYR